MKTVTRLGLVLLLSAAFMNSKDKVDKVPYSQMANSMRDAFNCGVIVEQYLHGKLKGNEEGYKQERVKYNCGYVEQVLNTLGD